MGAMPNEPSMEEILSSIKRIIAEEDRGAPPPRAPRRAAANGAVRAVESAADEQILELTETLPEEPEILEEQSVDLADDTQPTEQVPEPDAAPAEAPIAAQPAVLESVKPDLKPARTDAPIKAEPKAPRRDTATPSARKTAMTQAVLSDVSAQAARESLVHLSQLLVRPEDGQSNTLEGLVREMLRPMLKDWLDAHLPEMVEAMVKREIDRITGRV